MFKFWPGGSRAEQEKSPIAALFKKYQSNNLVIRYKEPEEKKMNKEESKTKARKCFDTYEDRAASMVHDLDAAEYRVTYKGATGERTGFTFEYTPEPPSIKEGVLCVGVSTWNDSETIGRICYGKGRAILNNHNVMTRVENARPVTPADLADWGLESTWSCSNCKNEGNSTICGKCEYITWRGRFEERG